MNKNRFYITLAFILLGSLASIAVNNYFECRDHGFSRTYCLSH